VSWSREEAAVPRSDAMRATQLRKRVFVIKETLISFFFSKPIVPTKVLDLNIDVFFSKILFRK
jgi:hypothetical protein